MHHVAIMRKSWKLIPKILSGEKTIESRWYQTRRSPWNTIHVNDTVFFKNAGEPITARATVSRVLQFEIKNTADAEKIVRRYGKQICILNTNPKTWATLPRYCILVFLKDATPTKLILIDKKGFGISSAWLSVPSLGKIRVK